MTNKMFHETGHGWNYGFQTDNGLVRPIRYWTNGGQNSSYEFGVFKASAEPQTSNECMVLFHAK